MSLIVCYREQIVLYDVVLICSVIRCSIYKAMKNLEKWEDSLWTHRVGPAGFTYVFWMCPPLSIASVCTALVPFLLMRSGLKNETQPRQYQRSRTNTHRGLKEAACCFMLLLTPSTHTVIRALMKQREKWTWNGDLLLEWRDCLGQGLRSRLEVCMNIFTFSRGVCVETLALSFPTPTSQFLLFLQLTWAALAKC